MSTSSSVIEEREQWRARILRALAELRGDTEPIAQGRGDDDGGDDAQTESSKI